MRPLVQDHKGIVRFKQNSMVRSLLDKQHYLLNDLCNEEHSQEDMDEFFQMIGYSVCGYCDVSLVSEESKDEAWEAQNVMEKGVDRSPLKA